MNKLITRLVFAMALLCNPVSALQDGVSLALAKERAGRITELRYDLAFVVPANREENIRGRVTIAFELSDTERPLALDFRGRTGGVAQVSNARGPVDYTLENEHILLTANALAAGHNSITVEFIAGDSSLNRKPDFLYTLFVPDRARTAFPLFDQPDLKARYTLRLELPAGWTALANAPLDDISPVEGGGQRFSFATSDPISSYLFSFVAGQFERVTRTVDGRKMTMLHRESDAAKLARNIDEIFSQHSKALDWMEDYTDVPYPFQTFDFALVPAFQYGGMEHVGAILYRAEKLLLDDSPTQDQLLDRASLIAHETAHMWFGNLVTMRWFDDVWTKEVFANFMAAKIINPRFPDINHDLNFLMQHYPAAYGVDRTAGANPIRQHLPNLKEAGQLYGPIIYNKAPIMMRQLELLLGEQGLREGLSSYLKNHQYGNADWPGLVAILDKKTPMDLATWSKVWVNSPGRPAFTLDRGSAGETVLVQRDPAGLERVWPQALDVRGSGGELNRLQSVTARTTLPVTVSEGAAPLLLDASGLGYGLFPADEGLLQEWDSLDELARGAVLVNTWENLLEGRVTNLENHASTLLALLAKEENQLLASALLAQLSRLQASFLDDEQRASLQAALESTLWDGLESAADPGLKRLLFEGWSALVTSPESLSRLENIWLGEMKLSGLALEERDRIRLAEILAVRLPTQWQAFVARQLEQTANPDDRRRLEFITPALSGDPALRDRFFASLALPANRETESWVLDALGWLHHPSRIAHAEKYILPSLELLEEIQVTGDIFFPAGWIGATLRNHYSDSAVETVRTFLEERPDYNAQLRMKIEQAADLAYRANALRQDSPQ